MNIFQMGCLVVAVLALFGAVMVAVPGASITADAPGTGGFVSDSGGTALFCDPIDPKCEADPPDP